MKRFTATEKWQKDWFQSLTPGQKCLWNYLCDNCDAGGVWEPNWRLASFVINETFTAGSLAIFGDRVRILPDGKIWLTGFCEFQYSHLSRDCRAHTHIIRILEKHGLLHEVEHLLSPPPQSLSDTLSYRVADRDKDTDKDTETQTEKHPEPDDEPARRRNGKDAKHGRNGTLDAVGGKDRSNSNSNGNGGGGAALLLAVEDAGGVGGATRTPPRGGGDLAALGQRIGAIMRRRPGSRWSEREQSAVAALFPLAEDDLLLIERYYGAEIARAEDFRRRDLLTLLNNWPGELDRARAFWRKRGWRLPGADDPAAGDAHGGGGGGGSGKATLPERFAAWKAQAPEYAGTAWRDWSAVPPFAREEFLRWKKGR